MVNGELSGSKGKKTLPMQLKKAGVLGFETRNVSTHWLQPVLRKGAVVEEEDHGSASGSDIFTQSAPNPKLRASGMASYHNPGDPNWTQLSPNYGPGQNTPKELAALRVTRTLQGLGRTAIYSNSPYIDNAIESLIPDDFKTIAPGASPYSMPAQMGQRSLHGKLPRKGSKAAALSRAKRLVAAGASFRPEVPFEDAVRVCNLSGDRTAVPALLLTYMFGVPGLPVTKLEHYAEVLAVQPPLVQLQAVALLLQSGYYFSAIKIVYGDLELLRATLEELRLLLEQGMGEDDLEVAAQSWVWREADRELFLRQFRELQIITHYQDVRRQLRAMRSQGAVALARVEREMISKVVSDFMAQLEEDWEQQQAVLKARHDEELVLAAKIAEQQAADAAALAAQQAEAEARSMAAADKRRRDELEQAEREEVRRQRIAEKEEEERLTAVAAAELEEAQRTAVATPMAEARILGMEDHPLGEIPPQSSTPEPATTPQRRSRPPSLAASREGSIAGDAPKPRSRPPSLAVSRVGSMTGSPRPTLTPIPDGAVGSKPSSRVPSRSGSVQLESLGSILHSPAPGRSPSASAPGTPKLQSKPGSPTTLSKPSTPTVLSKPGTPTILSKPGTPTTLSIETEAELADAPKMESPKDDTPKVDSPKADSATGDAASLEGAVVVAIDVDAVPSPKTLTPGGSPRPAEALPPGSPLGSRPVSVQGSVPHTPSRMSKAPSRLPTPPAQVAASPLGSRPTTAAGEERPGMEEGVSKAPSRLPTPPAQVAASPLCSRPNTAAGEERPGVEEGIAELKMQMSVTRKLTDEAAEKLKRLSRPITPLSGLGTPRSGSGAGSVGADQETLDSTLVAQALMHQELAAAEREQLLAAQAAIDLEAAEAKAAQERIDAEQAEVERAMREKEAHLAQLEEERARLESSQAKERAQLKSAEEKRSAAERLRVEEETKAHIAAVEAKIVADLLAVEAMKVEKMALERERLLERQRYEARMKTERKALHAQVTKTMKGFQEQLAQSVKMAAMMQAQRIMQGGTGPVQAAIAPVVSLPTEVDEPPTKEEVLEYANYLGINTEEDPDLVYIAEWALTAPVPDGWTVHLDAEGHEFFHNNVTAVSVYEHPMDEHYRLHYLKARTDKTRSMAMAAGYV